MSLLFEKISCCVVPVICGSTHGTAFFVEDGRLLTARHVVEENLRHRIPVLVYVGDTAYQYSAVSIGNSTLMADVAMLTPTEQTPVIKNDNLPLLAIDFAHSQDMNLTILGYPGELGSGSSLIIIKVRNHSKVSNHSYDVLTARSDFFELRTYCGFSGSPVVTEGGLVIGVVTTETFGKLGYCSIELVHKLLKQNGLKNISTDWETNDETSLSKKKCCEQIGEAIEIAGPRYHKKNHQKDEKLMDIVDWFSNYRKYKTVDSRLTGVEKDLAEYKNHQRIVVPQNVNYDAGKYENLPQYIDKLLAEPYNAGTIEEMLRKLKHTVELNLPRYLQGKEKFLRITGVAGTGKTHFSCYIAEYLESKAYPYLLFGSQFNTAEPIFTQLAKYLPFGGNSKGILKDGFALLDERMKETDQFAVLIIDALNEGAGEFFWKDSLRVLAKEIGKYERWKLIVTIRDPFVDRIMGADNDWLRYDLKGFSSPKNIANAMRSYFAEYGIDESVLKGFRSQFKLPLFLIIFCQSYSYLSEEERRKLDRLTLYKRYLKARNVNVADIVDEDDKRNITWQMMDKVAMCSVEKYQAGVIEREEAREIADSICQRELWKNNLLNALLKENLLMETLSKDDRDMVMFEFENIGDVLKANALLNSKKSDSDIMELLDNTSVNLEKNNLSSSKFDNMVTALIAMWNRDKDVIEIEEFIEGKFRPMLIRAVKEYATEANGSKIKRWLDETKSEYEPLNLLHNLDNASTDLFNRADLSLSKMAMKERDIQWTIPVNDFFNNKSSWAYLERMSHSDSQTQSRLLHVAIWMLTTSFPDSRLFLIGLIFRLMMQNESLIMGELEDFKTCDDHYVLTGLYCAVYGVMLRTSNHKLVESVAKYVKNRFYSNEDGKVVADINLRQWTLMILDRAEFLMPSNHFFSDLKIPFKSSHPTKRMLKMNIPDNYFGEGKGAAQLAFSLSVASDFYRYTLGGNSFDESGEFFELDEKGEPKALKLRLIPRMIASIIKRDYGYSKELDYYDGSHYSKDRHHNVQERIGKKYQWLALWRIYAQLCDNYLFKQDRFYPDPITLNDVVWPWQTNMYDRNDPAMPTMEEMREYTKGLDFLPEHDERVVDIKNGKDWVDSEESHPVVNTQYLHSNGEIWVLLYGYQSDKVKVDGENRDSIIHYNCCFVDKQDDSKMDKWAEATDFSGNWMEHRQDCIDFRWNEFPWSHAYKQLNRDEWVIENGRVDYPCNVKVSYDEQLQEEVYGMIDDKEYHSFSVGMPCAELIETMNLYTAERGLIRKMDNDEIVAVSFSVLEGKGTGLLIKKDILCQFMRKKKYSLYCYLSGNKEISIGSYTILYDKNLSGCMKMDGKGEWKTVQLLRTINRKGE